MYSIPSRIRGVVRLPQNLTRSTIHATQVENSGLRPVDLVIERGAFCPIAVAFFAFKNREEESLHRCDNPDPDRAVETVGADPTTTDFSTEPASAAITVPSATTVGLHNPGQQCCPKGAKQ